MKTMEFTYSYSYEVRLKRRVREPWGFRLIGGVDFDMPLTVVKVIQDSPAERAGLQHGDTVISINDKCAGDMSQDAARQIVGHAGDALVLEVSRGLYDPVLDDLEPTYEPLDLEDFDQPSQSEVPVLLNFQENLEPNLQNGLSENRSLTASPYINPTKPYRPFSTEPLPEVPTLEDPIILNPSYNDDFSKILGIDDQLLPQTKFKLPISKHYDPNVKNKEMKEKNQEIAQHEKNYLHEMKQEIDMEKIELTATDVVDDILEKTMPVTKEITKKNYVELQESSQTKCDVSAFQSESLTVSEHVSSKKETSQTSSVTETLSKDEFRIDWNDPKCQLTKESAKKEVQQLVKILDQTTEQIIKDSDKQTILSVAEEVKKIETAELDTHKSVEHSDLAKKELDETIAVGSLKKKSEILNIETDESCAEINSDYKLVASSQHTNLKSETMKMKTQEITTDQQSQKKDNESKTSSQTKMSTSNLLDEQRAYTIGLQTIPNLRGSIHSSYHYNLLLKTFFIHLTDVMVALSRFILTEPAFNEETKEIAKEVVNKTVSETKSVDKKESIKVSTEDLQKQKVEQRLQNKDESSTLQVSEQSETRKLSGSKLAQIVENKPEELIHGMGAVITEFQSQSSKDKNIEISETKTTVTQEVEEHVALKSEHTKISKISHDTHKEASQETKKEKSTDTTTYVGVVESHVYTNKDAILEEQFCETSMQSAEEISKQTEEALTEDVFLEQANTVTEMIQQVNENEKMVVSSIVMEMSEAKETSKFDLDEQCKTITSQTIQEESCSQEIHENLMQIQADFSERAECQQIVQLQPTFTDEFLEHSEEMNEIEQIKADIDQRYGTNKKEIEDASETVEFQQINNAEILDEIKTSLEIFQESKSKIVEIKQEQKVDEQTFIHETKKELNQQLVAKVGKDELKANEITSKEVLLEEDITTEESATIMDENQENEEVATFKLRTATVSDEIINENLELSAEDTHHIREAIENLRAQMYESSFVARSVESTESKKVSFITDSEIREEIENNHQENKKTTLESNTEITEQVTDSNQERKKLTLELNTEIDKQKSESLESVPSTITTTIPATTPPTPLTDEYIFRLLTELPKGITPIFKSKSPSPEQDEDPHIVKKKLIPHIDTTIEHIVYDTPLPTPPGSPTASGSTTGPVYTKPGLKGGAIIRLRLNKEEILEFERKSSLLASAIDQTIRSIEEYKQEVGIKQSNTQTNEKPVIYNGYAKVIETKVFDKPVDKTEEWVKDSKQVDEINSLSKSVVQSNTENREVKATQVSKQQTESLEMEDSLNPPAGYRPVHFDPEDIWQQKQALKDPHKQDQVEVSQLQGRKPYVSETGEPLGTNEGFVDGLEETAIVDEKVAKQLGKPGMSEDKIAELMSGESEMLREAHVMGLKRVLASHMNRTEDDSSVDFKKIKPILTSLKDSEVIKALNEEFTKTKVERKKDERKWTTFMQRPQRPVPQAKFGYHGWTKDDLPVETPYKPKIVKQPKPKVAPDYKPENFETGLLPWEERALSEPPPPPVAPEDPILIPEEQPVFLEVIDPLPESEVPDLEETGIPLPEKKEEVEETKSEEVQTENETKEEDKEETQELDLEAVVEETQQIIQEMEENKIAEQLMQNVQNLIDPNAPLEQQLTQMRAQLAALAQLPAVIQQSLERVTRQLSQLSHQDLNQAATKTEPLRAVQEDSEENPTTEGTVTEVTEEDTPMVESSKAEEMPDTENEEPKPEEQREEPQQIPQKRMSLTQEELEKLKKEEEEMLDEQRRIEKQKKEHSIFLSAILEQLNSQDLMAQMKQEQEARQLKQRPTPRVGKPQPMFGPLTPQERPLVLPGGRKWRKPKDAYNDNFIAETLTAQAEIIMGKAKGMPFESVRLPYDYRVNFMKYEKPPVSLDHLKDSDTYKLIHDMEQDRPMKRVEMLTPVIAEADYREKCRSMTPCRDRMTKEQHLDYPQQVQP